MGSDIRYTLQLSNTEAATGFFNAVPDSRPDLEESLALLRQRPMDHFLHRYALSILAETGQTGLEDLIKKANADNDRILQALACEVILMKYSLPKAEQYFSRSTLQELCQHTPLINIRSAFENNRRLHAQWTALFRKNIVNHIPLPRLDDSGLPPLCAGDCRMPQAPVVELKDIRERLPAGQVPQPMISVEQTARKALERLTEAGIDMDPEMRHESSLSPFALLRRWRFTTHTDNRRNRFVLSGGQTSYGKGLTLEDARASLLMEIVERCSSFASIAAEGVTGYQTKYPLEYARFSDLVARGITAVNPDELSQEITYKDEPLHWIQGTTTGPEGPEPAMIPVQSLFLFCNLDEVNLYSGLGSTGLASGNTMEQAKVSALMEVIERNQEGTVPFDTASCFNLTADDPVVLKVLQSYHALGIHLQFQDITPASGIPCCKCFVRGRDGIIHKGASANLNARRAILSAMTETTYPFPSGPPSAEGMNGLILVGYENLPDYSTGSWKSDLALMESLLTANGQRPYYVDLTREDIGIPVVKAVIPGMEVLGDFDEFSRVHPQLFLNYMKIQNAAH